MNSLERANSVSAVVKPKVTQEYSLCMEKKEFYGKCRGNRVIGGEKVFSSFQSSFPQEF